MYQDRYDVIRLDARAAVRTDEGFLKVPARITRTGIMEYHRGGQVVRELRSPDEVFREDSIATLAGVPVTRGHAVPFVTARDTAAHAIGYVGSDVKAVDGRYLEATLHVWRADAVDAIEARELTEVSAGYRSKLQPGGVYQGQKYDLAQTDIRYNHAALLPPGAARGGSELAVRLDGHDLITLLRERLGALGLPESELASALGLPDADGVRLLLDGHLGTPDVALLTRAANMIHVPVSQLLDLAPAPAPQPPKVSRMKRQLTINGTAFEVEVPDAVASTFDSAVAADAARAEQVRTDAADASDKLKAVETERDELKTRCDAAEAQVAAAHLASVIAVAKPLFPEVKGATVREVHESTLKHLGHGERIRTDASDDEVAGMFAMALSAGVTKVQGVVPSTNPEDRNDAKDPAVDTSSAAARQRMLERNRNAWKLQG